MKPDPDAEAWRRHWIAAYARDYYERGPLARLLWQGHVQSERAFDRDRHFGQVLEVGAGGGHHLRAVRHRFDTYWATDADPEPLQRGLAGLAQARSVVVRREDATALSFGDDSIDRLVACHVLEHLPQPHRVLREWARVVRAGGVITLLLPCDPGLAWRWGRSLGPRRRVAAAGLPYDYWMAREHINPVQNLVALVRYYFDRRQELWYPARVPSFDLNLFFICHLAA